MKGYRTVIVNILFGIVPALEAAGFQQYLPDEYIPFYMLGMIVANVILRAITDTPIGKKHG